VSLDTLLAAAPEPAGDQRFAHGVAALKRFGGMGGGIVTSSRREPRPRP
jgi:hypothetical protein